MAGQELRQARRRLEAFRRNDAGLCLREAMRQNPALQRRVQPLNRMTRRFDARRGRDTANLDVPRLVDDGFQVGRPVWRRQLVGDGGRRGVRSGGPLSDVLDEPGEVCMVLVDERHDAEVADTLLVLGTDEGVMRRRSALVQLTDSPELDAEVGVVEAEANEEEGAGGEKLPQRRPRGTMELLGALGAVEPLVAVRSQDEIRGIADPSMKMPNRGWSLFVLLKQQTLLCDVLDVPGFEVATQLPGTGLLENTVVVRRHDEPASQVPDGPGESETGVIDGTSSWLELSAQEAAPEVSRLIAQTPGSTEVVVFLFQEKANQLAALLPDLARQPVGAAQQEVPPTREEGTAVLPANGHGDTRSHERDHSSLCKAMRQGLRDVHRRRFYPTPGTAGVFLRA